MAFQIVRNVMGHAGVELYPASMARSSWLGWNNTTTHHDLHHQTGRYNFGLYSRWWDRLMGTEHAEYLELHLGIHALRTPHAEDVVFRRALAGGAKSANALLTSAGSAMLALAQP
jgi:sterol desaturase/sphingolipid hydroxylase (fatty acid hydroxylase superfamily)